MATVVTPSTQIEAGLAAALTGDTVIVKAGTYTPQVNTLQVKNFTLLYAAPLPASSIGVKHNDIVNLLGPSFEQDTVINCRFKFCIEIAFQCTSYINGSVTLNHGAAYLLSNAVSHRTNRRNHFRRNKLCVLSHAIPVR